MTYFRAFLAGFVSTLVFHQGVLEIFHILGAYPNTPWSLAPVPPLGVPSVISLSFWAGLWGIVLWPLLRNASGGAYWARAVVAGALAPTAVALFIVFPLKGLEFAAGWNPKIIVGALIVNAAWGFGLALFLRTFRRIGI